MTNEKGPAPGRVAERRTHPRYGFTADAEIIEGGSGTRIEARIMDISERGCYVETARSFPLGTAIKVQITKSGESFVAPARVVYSSAKGMGLAFGQLGENQLEILEIWLGPLRERDWLVQNRRRTQRVVMRVPVRISGQNAVGSQFEEETHTLSVNANGALVVLSASIKKGQVIHLLNVAMGDKAECVVAHLGPRQGDQLEVGIAFRLPNPNFWRVAFPPRDWSPPEEF
jgi:PilZ domain-containing protein